MRAAWILLLTLSWTDAAWADPSDATRSAARDLGAEGVEDYQAGNYVAASDKLARAFKLVRAPSLGLWSARAFVKVGKLVEGAERYLDVTRLEVTQGDVAIQKQAKQDAAQEREALLPRIPSLRLDVQGASGEVDLTVDGAAVPSAIVGAKLPVNPGPHTVVAHTGNRTAKRDVRATEGQSTQVVLDVSLDAGADGPEPSMAAAPPADTPQEGVADQPKELGSRPLAVAAWIALGVGVLDLGLGVTTGLIAKGKKDELAPYCQNDVCDPSKRGEVDSYTRLRSISTVGFIAGGSALAAAGVLFMIAPRPAAKQGKVVPWLGLGSAGFSGMF